MTYIPTEPYMPEGLVLVRTFATMEELDADAATCPGCHNTEGCYTHRTEGNRLRLEATFGTMEAYYAYTDAVDAANFTARMEALRIQRDQFAMAQVAVGRHTRMSEVAIASFGDLSYRFSVVLDAYCAAGDGGEDRRRYYTARDAIWDEAAVRTAVAIRFAFTGLAW